MQKQKISFSDVISLIALFIALFSFISTIFLHIKENQEIISIFQYDTAINEITEFTDGSELGKDIYVVNTPNPKNGSITITNNTDSALYVFINPFPINFKMFPGYYTETERIAISNNSNHDISIIGLKSTLLMYMSQFDYEFGHDELVELPEIKIPINLLANNTILLDVTIKYPISRKVFEILSEQYNINARYELKDLLQCLYKNGIDQFGNTIQYYEIKNGPYKVIYHEDRIAPVLKLEFKTSKGTNITTFIKPR